MLFQPLNLAGQFTQNVFNSGQVVAGVGQAVAGFAAALLVFRHSSGFFQKNTQLFGAGFNNSGNHALPNNGVSAWPQPCAQKNVLHIAAANRLLIDVIGGGTIARQYALDRYFRILVPAATRPALSVVEHQFHAGSRRSLSVGRAIEDHVLHGLTTQL